MPHLRVILIADAQLIVVSLFQRPQTSVNLLLEPSGYLLVSMNAVYLLLKLKLKRPPSRNHLRHLAINLTNLPEVLAIVDLDSLDYGFLLVCQLLLDHIDVLVRLHD